MFTSEEPTRFSLSCSGSRAMAGVLGAEELEAKKDGQGMHFIQASRVCMNGQGTGHAIYPGRT